MMRRVLPSILLLLLSPLASSSAQTPKPLPPTASSIPAPANAADVTAIHTLRTQWAEALRARHLEESLAFYSKDAAFLEPRGTRIEGQQALHDLFQTVMAATDSAIQFNSLAVQSSGDLAFDSGTYTETTLIHSTTTPIHIAGNYLTVYQRAPDGRWLILQQAWTVATPSTH